MFLKTRIFKQLLKEAYKSDSLRIANLDGIVILNGGYWTIGVPEEQIPKKERAAIVEITGLIPKPGERYWIGRAGTEYDEWEVDGEIARKARLCQAPLKVTKVLIERWPGDNMRVLQEPYTGRIFQVPELIVQMVDYTCTEKNRETYPEGPLIGTEPGAFWVNNVMTLRVTMTQEETALTKSLEGIRIE